MHLFFGKKKPMKSVLVYQGPDLESHSSVTSQQIPALCPRTFCDGKLKLLHVSPSSPLKEPASEMESAIPGLGLMDLGDFLLKGPVCVCVCVREGGCSYLFTLLDCYHRRRRQTAQRPPTEATNACKIPDVCLMLITLGSWF